MSGTKTKKNSDNNIEKKKKEKDNIDFDELARRKEELTKELRKINGILKIKNSNDYQKREENMKLCECCDLKMTKYAFDKHQQTESHKLKQELSDLKKLKLNM